MAKPVRKRTKSSKDTGRRAKKKVSPLVQEGVPYIDYKDVNLLRRFMSDRAKIRSRRVSGNDTQQQAEVAKAIKNAREMGLLPYASKVTTQRKGRSDRGERGDRGDRGDRPDRGDRGDRGDRMERRPTPSVGDVQETVSAGAATEEA